MNLKFPKWEEFKKQIVLSLICLFLTVPLSVIAQKALANTHALDGVANWLTARLVRVDANSLAWIAAFVLWLGVYLFTLRKIAPKVVNHHSRDIAASAASLPSFDEVARGAGDRTAADASAEFLPGPESPSIVKAIARADILRRFIPEAEKRVADAKAGYEEWLSFSDEKIWGSGLTSGNHRQYAWMYRQWRHNVDMSLVGWMISPPVQPEPVKPEEVLLTPVRNDRNIYNPAGDMPDEERKLQHRVWETEGRRLLAALDAALDNLKGELGQIENEIHRAGMEA